MKKIFFTTLSLLALASCTITPQDSQSSEQKEFEGISFRSETFVYDGLEHSIYVENAPSFANVSYQGNNQIDAGSYTVKATVEADGYFTLELNATLTITPIEFEGLVFDDLEVEYSGEPYSIYVKNLPSFASVSYTGNNVSSVGFHEVKATVTAKNYRPITLTAYITIKSKTFEGITFPDGEFTYDGKSHSISAVGVPSFAKASYSNNGQIEVGKYTVTATITAKGYQTLTLNAILWIKGISFEGIHFPNRTIIYNSRPQTIAYYSESTLPSGTSVTYALDGKTVDQIVLADIGTYNVSLTVKNDAKHYEPLTINSVVNITENTFGVVDESQAAYPITENIKFDDLYKQILKCNYTVVIEYGDSFSYKQADDKGHKEGDYEYKASVIEEHFVTPNAYFENSYRMDDGAKQYNLPETENKFTYFIGDYAVSTYFEEGHVAYRKGYRKYSKDAYKETVLIETGMAPFAYLNKAEDGGFEDGSQGGYVTSYGHATIDTENNVFKLVD